VETGKRTLVPYVKFLRYQCINGNRYVCEVSRISFICVLARLRSVKLHLLKLKELKYLHTMNSCSSQPSCYATYAVIVNTSSDVVYSPSVFPLGPAQFQFLTTVFTTIYILKLLSLVRHFHALSTTTYWDSHTWCIRVNLPSLYKHSVKNRIDGLPSACWLGWSIRDNA
jgi:hypothetical protein